MKKRMRRIVQVMSAVAVVLMLALAGDMPARASGDGDFREEVKAYADIYRVDENDRISEGISIAGLDVGGMTLMEVVDAMSARQEAMKSAEITLMLEDRSVTYSMAELGLSMEVAAEDVVRAACLGKTGSLVERYKVLKEISHGGYDVLSEQSARETLVADKIAKFAKAVNIPAVEATITKNGSKFEVTQESAGVAVDEEDMLKQVMEAISHWNGDAAITLVAKEIVLEPKYTYEALSTISDCLGAFAAGCGEIDTDRGKNIINGASKMDGNIVLPGESYSVVDVIGPFTKENGYHDAIQYIGDTYDMSAGGGVCTISSTMYNTLLLAELDIQKRWNHSMTVAYVPYGFDSTVNDDGSRDLVFVNNYETPIYIETYIERLGVMGTWLHINIYGKETRDTSRREVKYYNNVLEEDLPTEDEYIYQIDYTLEPGEEVWDRGNYPYVPVEAYKEVWIDGVMVSKELMHTDTYLRAPAIIRYNPTEPSTEATTEEDTTEALPEESTAEIPTVESSEE